MDIATLQSPQQLSAARSSQPESFSCQLPLDIIIEIGVTFPLGQWRNMLSIALACHATLLTVDRFLARYRIKRAATARMSDSKHGNWIFESTKHRYYCIKYLYGVYAASIRVEPGSDNQLRYTYEIQTERNMFTETVTSSAHRVAYTDSTTTCHYEFHINSAGDVGCCEVLYNRIKRTGIVYTAESFPRRGVMVRVRAFLARPKVMTINADDNIVVAGHKCIWP
jgi:hypothetical protein